MALENGTLSLTTAPVFKPLFQDARYKGAYGGRGSGKSHFFAELLVQECCAVPGTRAVCIREVQKDLAHSSKALIERKIQELGVGQFFHVTREHIVTPGDGIILFQGMQDHTGESIKSLEAFRIAWVEEAQMLSERSLVLLRPTIRAEGSQIWFSWNPRRKSDAVDRFLRPSSPEGAIVIKVNHNDNPWFPDVLKAEMLLDLNHYPERYAHIWEGAYATAFEGAYYARALEDAKAAGRILRLGADPIIRIRAFWDLGGAGAKGDATAIWICQWVDREIRILDYIEGQGQVLSYYVNELRKRGYESAICYLPHDGVAMNAVTGKRISDHLEDAEFEVEIVKNQGMGAASMRIESARRIFSICYFDDVKTEPGRDALGYYHERRDETRNVGLGPEHDWSSHAADAFGLLAIAYEAPEFGRPGTSEKYRPSREKGKGAWLGM